MSRPTPMIMLLFLVASSYGGPWGMSVPTAYSSSSSEVMMEVISPLRTEQSEVICTVNGIFPMPDSCQRFYQCDDWDGLVMRMYQFTCPNGTIFDDHLSICNFPSLVKSRPACTSIDIQGYRPDEDVPFAIINAGYDMKSLGFASGDDSADAANDLILNEILDRTKRSAPIEDKCYRSEGNLTEEVNSTHSGLVAKQAVQTCKQIYYVNEYVDKVTSMITIPYLPNINDSAVDKYNSAVEAAQNHTDIWRYGDSILSGFRRTYLLAKLFGPKFERNYAIAEERVKIVNSSSADLEQREELLDDIVSIEEILEYYRMKEINQPSEKLTELIASNEKRLLDKRQKLREISAVEKDLEEIVLFLEIVKVDAGRIKERANLTRQKLKTFRDHTMQDRSKFFQSKKLAESALNTSKNQINQILKDIDDYEKLKNQTEKERNELDAELAKIEDDMKDTLNGMREKVKRYIERVESVQDRNIFDRIGVFFAGGPSLDSLKSQMNVRKFFFKDEISLYESRVKIKSSKADVRTEKIYNLADTIIQKGNHIRNLEFSQFYLDLVIKETNGILPYIQNAICGLKALDSIFDNIVFQLESLIHEAKDQKNKANARRRFYLKMSVMQTNWNDSYSNIIDIGRCTDATMINSLNYKITDLPLINDTVTELPLINDTVTDLPLINDTVTELPLINDTVTDLPLISVDVEPEAYI